MSARPDSATSRASAEDRAARLALTQIAEPGDADLGELVSMLGAAAAWQAVRAGARPDHDPVRWRAAFERWSPRVSGVDIEEQQRRATRSGALLITPTDPDWPGQLDDLGAHAPLCLWVRGTAALLHAPSVAIVGARAATGYGEHVAAEFAAELAGAGVTVVSGGAYGIDGTAHRATLGVGGATVAVLAGGADRVYPAGHAQLLNAVAARGAVIGEVPLGSSPTRWRFLLRNRVIAALSAVTVVVEAGWRSGSLNTAGHAASLGRLVAAVPGPVTSAASAGCHRLLREYDAICVTTAGEVLELLPGMASARRDIAAADAGGISAPTARVYDATPRRVPQTVTEIAATAGLSSSETEASLGFLQLEGLVRQREDGWVRA